MKVETQIRPRNLESKCRRVPPAESAYSFRKNSFAVRQVAALNSSSEQFLTCATVSEISFT